MRGVRNRLWQATDQLLVSRIFYLDGKAVRTEKMNRCVMRCDSNATTDEAVYRSKLTEFEEWPHS
jgi:hypothetical protein